MSPPFSPLLADYPTPSAHWDEMLAPSGALRPHYQSLAATLARLGPQGLALCSQQARRSIAENGVTYNVYGDPRGMDRPWEFDPVPFVIPSHEWAALEKGLTQRAHLLNAVLSDLYGPQLLLKQGLLPPGLVLGNPGFQFACLGLRPPEDTWLHLSAVDLARRPDGRWCGFADRTQTPSGSGYVLENRIVLSRSLPDDIRNLHVHRLANFFRVFRDNLSRLAPHPAQPHGPRIVLLTPGPLNETYFEHAYLSRYLGFPLVEGADLTVRHRKVFIKTLEGLQQVDVILRRVDDAFCDPLELRQDSFLGVPGLLEALRAHNVLVANPIGSGLAESPALLAFLPSLCRHLLGEDLLLPIPQTFWCGQRLARQHVLANLDSLLIKGALANKPSNPIFPRLLSSPDRAALIQKILRDPHLYVGQEQITLSQAPIWTGQALAPRPVALRAYLAAAPGGFLVMPGGLTRASASPNTPIVSMQSGGGSKDTWVLSDRPVPHLSLLSPGPQARIPHRALSQLTSRVADNLFWLGRYAERAETLIRLLRVAATQHADPSAPENPLAPSLLLHLLQPQTPLAPPDLGRPLALLLFNQNHPDGLAAALANLRRAAWSVRDHLSIDSWRILAELQQELPQNSPHLDDALLPLNRLIRGLSAFAGMAMENITRSHGWRFLDLGRRIERSDAILDLLHRALLVDPSGQSLLGPLLDIADSTMTYRRRYFAHAQTDAVLDLLLREEENPRSVSFQIHAVADHLRHLPSMPGRSHPGLKQQLVGQLRLRLRDLDPAAPPAHLAATLRELTHSLHRLSDRIAHVYFSQVGAHIT